MKLSEQLIEVEDLLRRMDVSVPDGLWSNRARDMEAEMERLRAGIFKRFWRWLRSRA